MLDTIQAKTPTTMTAYAQSESLPHLTLPGEKLLF